VKSEVKRKLLKSIKNNKNTTFGRRFLASYYLNKLPRISVATMTNKRCVVSGRV
jgi:hypothetical protein